MGIGRNRVRGVEKVEASTDRRIIEAAVRLFAAKGFQATGIREIATEAGVTSAALYHYMGTKGDLLVGIMRESMGRWIGGARRACAGLQSPEARVAVLVRVHVMATARYKLEAIVVDSEIRSLGSEARREIVALRDEYEGLLAMALRDGRESGVFETGDLRLARLALHEMCNGASRWYSPKGPASLEEIGDQFADMALALLRAQKKKRHLTVSDLDIPPVAETLRVMVEAYEEPLEGEDRISPVSALTSTSKNYGR